MRKRWNGPVRTRQDDVQLARRGAFRYSSLQRQWIPSAQKSFSPNPCGYTHSWPECRYMTFGPWICCRFGKRLRSRYFFSAQVRRIRFQKLHYPRECFLACESCCEKYFKWGNRTVHAANLLTLFRTEQGYRLFRSVCAEGELDYALVHGAD